MPQDEQQAAPSDLLAWHFLPHDRRLRKPLADGSRPVITAGWTFRADDPHETMRRRLDAFDRAFDAFRFGAGFVACRIRLSGDIQRTSKTNRLFATEFIVEWMYDATRVAHIFICDVVERLLLRERLAGREPDPVYWMALKIKRAWIANELGGGHMLVKTSPFSAVQTAIKEIAGDAPRPGQEWATWWQTAEHTYEATPEGATTSATMWATIGTERPIAETRSSRRLRRASTYGLDATMRQREAWTTDEQAAAVAAGLDLQPDDLNAEFERRLLDTPFSVK